jgi:hypothetical protein
VSNKPGHRGEREVSRKTIARGMPGRSGVTVVTTLVCLFFITHEAAGASSARHSLRPLISESGTSTANLGQNMQRDRETMFAVIARSEATKQSTLPLRLHGLLRGACHRAALCADPLARNDVECCGCLKFESVRIRGIRDCHVGGQLKNDSSCPGSTRASIKKTCHSGMRLLAQARNP